MTICSHCSLHYQEYFSTRTSHSFISSLKNQRMEVRHLFLTFYILFQYSITKSLYFFKSEKFSLRTRRDSKASFLNQELESQWKPQQIAFTAQNAKSWEFFTAFLTLLTTLMSALLNSGFFSSSFIYCLPSCTSLASCSEGSQIWLFQRGKRQKARQARQAAPESVTAPSTPKSTLFSLSRILSINFFSIILLDRQQIMLGYRQVKSNNQKVLSFLVRDVSISLGSFAHWAFSILLQPLHNTFFMINVVAFQFNYVFSWLEFAVAYCAQVFFAFFTAWRRLIFDFLQLFKFLFCKSLLHLLALPSRHEVEQSKEILEWAAASPALAKSKVSPLHLWELRLHFIVWIVDNMSPNPPSPIRLLNVCSSVYILNPPIDCGLKTWPLAKEMTKVPKRTYSKIIFITFLLFFKIVLGNGNGLSSLMLVLTISILAFLFLFHEVGRRNASTADLLMLVHQVFWKALSAIGAAFASKGALVGMSIELSQGLLVSTIAAWNFLLLRFIENPLPFNNRFSGEIS